MPCGPRARLTTYVAYQSLAFAEKDVLLAALADAGYRRVESAPAGTESANPVPVLDSDRNIVGAAALVVRREHLPAGFGDLGFVLSDGALSRSCRQTHGPNACSSNYARPTAARKQSSWRSRPGADTERACSARLPKTGPSPSGSGSELEEAHGRDDHQRLARGRARRPL
jgi:hypothetical protein